ncbi:conserved hypothetical protein [Acaryochloris marina MBIC11017]|uniref:Uncharacterized protein n=1 Tax=Acaryochloris marina (strain MBIC 11017) TaxID=329726 RepID=B0C2R3_ACAM1|nr:DUF2887 domain-containing protein [Acaryochloris marina]ABW30951.1 conserved hypothetical protein [Acaryochloris marina MBIC11017]
MNEPVDPLGVGLMQLIVADSEDTVTQAQALLSRFQPQVQINQRLVAIMKLSETIVVYTFPLLSRKEIEMMLSLNELNQTKVYLEVMLEKGQYLKLHQLTHRICDCLLLNHASNWEE